MTINGAASTDTTPKLKTTGRIVGIIITKVINLIRIAQFDTNGVCTGI